MANPIIKIKRGSGVPTPAGITSGEFAFDKNTNTLYLGASGGYCGIDAQGLSLADDQLNIIPVGMQISNDPFFGSTAPLNERLGYSTKTIPTTKAVKDYVDFVKSNEVLGLTLLGGPGIGLTFGTDGDTLSVTISNLGVLKGFTAVNVVGSQTVYAKSADDGITFTSGSGILITGNNSDNNLIFTNVGVTGINGVTGGITTIAPISGLSGWRQAVGTAVLASVSESYPISFNRTVGEGLLQIGHEVTSVISGNYNPLSPGGKWFIPNITVDEWGHISSIFVQGFTFGINNIPEGFVESVQDIIYGGWTGVQGISAGNPNVSGIGFTYSDNASNAGTFTAYLTGIKNLGVVGDPRGLSGNVRLNAGSDISLALDFANNEIDINYAGAQFRTITASKANTSGGYGTNASGIYSDGFVGPGAQQVEAENRTDTLKLFAGAGIGISAGELNPNDDGVLFWNAGVRGITFVTTSDAVVAGLSGNFRIKEGNNVSFNFLNNDTITISASTSGEGLGSIQADYGITQSNLTNNYSGVGVTGELEIIGLDGLITRQTINNETRNGDIYVGLSSNVTIPAQAFVGPTPPAYASLIVPNTRESIPNDNNITSEIGDADAGFAYTTVASTNYIQVDSIFGGFTANLQGSGYNGFIGDVDEPGKILRLVAEEGVYTPDGPPPALTGTHAEIRLLGWPNLENIAYELQSLYDSPGNLPCGGNVCVGPPPITPTCFIDGESSITDNDRVGGGTNLTKGTITLNGNVISKYNLVVDKDLWVAGDIYSAKTGCLIASNSGGPGGPGGGISTPGGNLGLTGDLVVQGSIYVHGFGGAAAEEAYFNVNKMAVEAPFIEIGGTSGGTQVVLGDQLKYRVSDKGILLNTYNQLSYNSSHNQSADGTSTGRNTFFGLKRSSNTGAATGSFVFLDNCTTVNEPFNDTAFSVTDPHYGNIFAGDYNGVGISYDASNGYIQFIKGSDPSTIATTNRIKGHFDIDGPSTSGSKATISLAGNSSLVMANSSKIQTTNTSVVVDFARGITVDVGNFGAQTNNDLKLVWKDLSNSTTRTALVRGMVGSGGSSTTTTLVDIGRLSTNAELPQQTLYNKTLADNCVIDCGTY